MADAVEKIATPQRPLVKDDPKEEASNTTAKNGESVPIPSELIRYVVAASDAANLQLDLSQRNVKLPLLSSVCAYLSLLNTPLVSLTLSKNALGPKGAMLLGKALVTNNTLHFLELDHCELAGSVYRPQYDGIKSLAKGFESVRSTLRFVSLAGNTLQPEGCRIVLGALSFHRTLTALDLSDNLLAAFNDQTGVLALASAVRFAKQLCWLAIDDNALSPATWQPLRDSLASNTTLTSLSMKRCQIPPLPPLYPSTILTDLGVDHK